GTLSAHSGGAHHRLYQGVRGQSRIPGAAQAVPNLDARARDPGCAQSGDAESADAGELSIRRPCPACSTALYPAAITERRWKCLTSLFLRLGRIAQLVEQLTLNQRVQGSSPCAPTNHFNSLDARQSPIPTSWSAV